MFKTKNNFSNLKGRISINYALLSMLSLCSVLLLCGCASQAQKNQPQFDTVQVVDNLVIDERSVPIFPRKAALTTDTARRFAIDLPKRCTVDWNNQRVLSFLPEQPVELIQLDKGDPLPAFAVSNFSFEKMYLKDVLTKLLDGTNIAVVEDENLPDKITGTIQSGDLSDAVELMAKMARAYFTYDNDMRELHVKRRASFMMKMPGDDDVIMALVDGMRGAGIGNTLVNWQDHTLSFDGNYQTEKEARQIITDLGSQKYIVSWDVDVYRVYPRTDNPIIWMNLLPSLGSNNVKMSIPGVVGRALVVSPEINTGTLQQFLSQQGNVVLISQGSFSMPNGWQSRFDIGQCSREERLETDLIIGADAKYGMYGGMPKLDAKIVLRTHNGEIASYQIPSNLGDNTVIIGIPTHTFVSTPETLISPFAELVVFMSPRLISVIKAGETPRAPLSGQALLDYL
ncbi:MAG: hypothetical protein FWC51_01275, partial [Proteobacteria bacterium]|nr:hypothetical protein [Pseudomonadota bacterium]